MNKVIHRITILVMVLVLILGNVVNAKAAGSVYYVSPTGNDTNPGTASAPFRTFAKANSVLTAGSTLYIYAGVYNQQLKITKSGTSTAVIHVKPVSTGVVIDLQKRMSLGVDVRASHVAVTGIEVKNSTGICVNVTGSYIDVIGLVVHDCASHGIQVIDSGIVRILRNRVYHAVRSNAAKTLTGGWGSGIKVRESRGVWIERNTVSNNFGEGMGTRGTYITIRGNVVYNNYSVNIYTNSENALIERNFVYCTPNSGYERSGLPAVGIGLGEEYYPGWGARLKNARVLNNIVSFCRNGIRYLGADAGVVGGGLKNATIAFNTLYGSTNAALSIVYESAQTGSLIANNIIWQAENNLTAIDNLAGLTFQNNLWKVAPAAAYRSPGDRYGDPKFAATPGYTTVSYRPSSTSPAAQAAANIGIAADFFARTRGPAFDIGAIQFSGSTAASTAQELESPIPTLAQPTNTLPFATLQHTATAVSPTTQLTTTSVPVTPARVEPTARPSVLPPTATFTAIPADPSPTATAPQPQPAPETVYDNKDSGFVYSEGWVEESSAYALSGSFARTSTNGASVSFTFTGQSLSLVYKGGPSYRKMDVYIDDVLVGTIDERLDTSKYKVRWDYPGQLSPGQHILKLVFVTTSSRTSGSVDAVIVR
jgi:hypothetical protein